MGDNLMSIESVTYDYLLGSYQVHALKGVDLTVARSSFITIMGPSGSGKSTLLSVLGLIDRPKSGTVYVAGKSLMEEPETTWNHFRRYYFGFIFQEFHLFPVLSAYENVEYFLSRQGVSNKERAERCEEALCQVGLKDQMKKRPGEMSGGQRQRVAIARALAKKPKLIIADEPTASLDQKTSAEILDILKSLTTNSDTTVITASHDQLVLDYTEILYQLNDGILIDQEGK